MGCRVPQEVPIFGLGNKHMCDRFYQGGKMACRTGSAVKMGGGDLLCCRHDSLYGGLSGCHNLLLMRLGVGGEDGHHPVVFPQHSHNAISLHYLRVPIQESVLTTIHVLISHTV